jgi:hypothetical protein
MGKYAQFITYKGKRILYVNCAGLPEAECVTAFEEMKQALVQEGRGVLVLADVTHVKMTKAVIDKAKATVDATKAIGIKDKPNAIVGLSGLQKAVVALFGSKKMGFVDTVEQGKEWLVAEDDKPASR